MSEPVPNPAEAFLALFDTFKQVIEFAAGYKAQAIEAGFDEDAATEMAVDAHRTVLSKMAGS